MFRWLLFFALMACAFDARAWIRAHYEDAQIVERSELIVVARIKPGSVEFVPNKPNSNGSHRAVLIIEQVLKGKFDEKETVVLIGYGIKPYVGGKDLKSGEIVINGKPSDQIALCDYSDSGYQMVQNAQENNIWFLRKLSLEWDNRNRRLKPGADFAVVDPEDIQPIELKDYLMAYMAKDPENAVKAIVATQPALMKRTLQWFDHLEVQRIAKIENIDRRAIRLAPYFLKWQNWYTPGSEAEDELVKCGDVGAAVLLAPYNDPAFASKRRDIIKIWDRMHNKGATGLLIELLQKHDQFWEKQTLASGWWNANVDSQETKTRRKVYGEVYSAVLALGNIDDSRAKEAVELTLKRWRTISIGNPQIVEACEAALKKWK